METYKKQIIDTYRSNTVVHSQTKTLLYFHRLTKQEILNPIPHHCHCHCHFLRLQYLLHAKSF